MLEALLGRAVAVLLFLLHFLDFDLGATRVVLEDCGVLGMCLVARAASPAWPLQLPMTSAPGKEEEGGRAEGYLPRGDGHSLRPVSGTPAQPVLLGLVIASSA